MEEASAVATLVISCIASLIAFVAALAALVTAYRMTVGMTGLRREVNGRMDQLLTEQEHRVRAQEQLRQVVLPPESLPPPPATGRGEPTIRRFPPDQPKGE